MDKEYIEEITITNAAMNCPGIDVSVVRDYMTGRTPEIKCKECKFKAAPLGDSTYCNKQKRIVYATGCNYGEPKRKTNADRIRAMSDEELAEYLFIKTCEDGFPQFTMKNDWLDWLKQEAK
jgi:hypothetical protein